MRVVTLCALVWIGWATPAGAAGEQYQGLPIGGIFFEPEKQPLPNGELERLLPLKTGDVLDMAEVREAIERLYATGRYRQISVDAQQRDGAIVLRVLTKGAWFVGRVTVDGVPEPPNRGQLISAAKLDLGEEFHADNLQKAVENLRARLESNGFYEARMNPMLDYEPETQQVHIDFQIDPGERARFAPPVIEGVPPSEFEQVVAASRWRRLGGLLGWKPVTEARVQQGLDRIRQSYSKENYLLSRVNLKEMDYRSREGQVTPVLDLELGPEVRIRTEGAKVSRGRLRQLVPVYQEQSADRDLLVEGMRNLTEYFQSQGYFQAQVDFQTQTEPDGSQTVVYRIDRKERYSLVHLEIQGNRYFDSDTIQERLSVQPATFLRYRHGRFSEAMLKADLEAIRDLYVSNGFRDAQVDSEIQENYRGKPRNLAVIIRIEEGPQWLVERLELEGVAGERRETIEVLLTSADGQPYSDMNLAIDRDNVLNYYYNHGFPDATFEWTVAPSAQPNRMQVFYQVTEGRQRFVRGYLAGGLRTSDPDMVYERIRLTSGDPLSQGRLIESQRRLYDLGVFARVDMALQNPEGNEDSKYVLYQFEEARKYSLNLGFGAEIARIGAGDPNFDAPAGEPGFSPRVSLGVSRSNLFGVGHTAGVQTRVSNIQQRGLVTYLAPQFKGSENTSLTVSLLYDISRDIRTFESRRQEGSVQLSQRLSRADTLQGRFTYRRNTVRNLAIDESLIPIFSRPVRVGIASGTFFQDRRDDPIDSTRGFYNSIDLGVASGAFASESDFIRVLARNSTYHPILRDMVLARTVTLGWLHNLGPGGADAIPLAERFFSGGGSSHRGFPDNQAGPRDLTTGFPLGGSGLFTNSVELRFPLLGDSLGGVLFHDAGNIFPRLRRLSFRVRQRDLRDFNYMVHAAGFGIRYRTPVGPIRLDLALSPNAPQFSFFRTPEAGGAPQLVTQRISRFQFHFSLGQTF